MRPKNACTVHGSKSVQLCMPNWMLYCVLSVFRWLCNRNRNPDMCAMTIHRQLRIAYLRIKRKSNSFLHWLITIIIIIIATDQLALCSYEIAVLREITHLLSQTHIQTHTHAIACCLFFFSIQFHLIFPPFGRPGCFYIHIVYAAWQQWAWTPSDWWLLIFEAFGDEAPTTTTTTSCNP